MAGRRRVKKQTLAEFRAWLSGVEELQPEAWAPSADQWKLIREKIDGIIEPKSAVDASALAKMLEGYIKPTSNPAFNVMPVQGNPHQMTAAHIPPPPPPAGGVPAGQVMTAQDKPPVPVMPVQPPVDLSGPATPNLDTSDGSYDSSFS